MSEAKSGRIEKVSDLQLHWVEDENSESGYYDENTLVNKPTSRYYYDGQMMIEDDYFANAGSTSSTWTVTRYGLGARGIDYMSKVTQSGPQGESFPIYDGHGNMVATLSRSGSNNFALANFRSYDVWGSVRQQNTVDSDGGPSQRYCANLGHVQDDESDLIYMRARYYEPSVGRFLSEDMAQDGYNWYVYVANNPISSSDATGKSSIGLAIRFIISVVKFLMGEFLLGKIEDQEAIIRTCESRLKYLDALIDGCVPGPWNDDAFENRRQVANARRAIKRLKFMQKVKSAGASALNGIAKLLGYSLILGALIDDIDYAPEGFGVLEFIHGT